MARRPTRVKEWTKCPACGFIVAAGYSSCTQCGHGAASWKLIADALRLEGTRDLGYNPESKANPQKESE